MCNSIVVIFFNYWINEKYELCLKNYDINEEMIGFFSDMDDQDNVYESYPKIIVDIDIDLFFI